MDSIHYESLLRLFQARRLCPWEPEHALFIAGELAKLKVTEPKDYESYKEFYDQRLKEYTDAQVSEVTEEPTKSVEEVVKEVTSDGEVTMEDLEKIAAAKKVKAAPKKPGRPKKS